MTPETEAAHVEALLEDERRRGRPELSIACPACHAEQGHRCHDYRGKRKQSCKERLLDERAQAARARYVARADEIRAAGALATFAARVVVAPDYPQLSLFSPSAEVAP